ncbi:citrulline utilization hydrolase CtlX [Portibacter marinus]|uniref:citrulline utilization hydrolase CtlX n=1 Tax=Portibacter marinus TaxID=2898660 RepID=UPI001F247060|nr:arginine deiminase-related protein [Portibacter marinus]
MATTTDTIFMVRPSNFGYNHETAENNAFQDNSGNETKEQISEMAKVEFDGMVENLRDKGIEVIVYEDLPDRMVKDSVFPNNWITTHQNNVIITYPIFAESRRMERREDIVDDLKERFGFERQYFFEHYEGESKFLEGTGSMILDRDNRIIYACLSDRTDVEILEKFSILMNYNKIFFHAEDADGIPIYHTNVMMALGEELCILCKDSITDEKERAEVIDSLEQSGKEIIEISIEQMNHFAGNMLEVKNKDGYRYMVMSEQAYKSLNQDQITKIEHYAQILHSPLYTIEKYGGGSARCMIAEIFA